MFLQKLRNETDPHHRALEQNSLSASLMDEKVSQEDLAVYLEKLYGFVQPFETRFYPRLKEVITDLEERKKARVLQSDLSALGKNDPDAIKKIDAASFNRIYPDLPSLVGGLYVLEGSVLGGAIIHRHLVARLGEQGNTQYFPVYGNEISKKWKGFMQQLEAYATEEHEEKIIEGAKQTFVLLDEWFGREMKL